MTTVMLYVQLLGLLNDLLSPYYRSETSSVIQQLRRESQYPSSARGAEKLLWRCGPNSLYLFLRLHGVAVEYGEIDSIVDVGEHGVSMLQLRHAARSVGLSVDVRRYREVATLRTCMLPVIGYLSQVTAVSGHFVLIQEVDEDYVGCIDGTTGRNIRFPLVQFGSLWSGYVLETPCVTLVDELRLFAVSALMWTIIGVCFGVWQFTRKGRKLTAVFAILSFLSAGETLAGGGDTLLPETIKNVDQRTWRTGRNDAVNCLYLLMAIAEKPVSYEEARSALWMSEPGPSLTSIKTAAQRLGISTTIYKSSPDAIRSMPMPLIAHMDPRRGGDAGRFVVLFSVTRDVCGIIDGGSAMISEIPIHEFRRDWSGYVIGLSPRLGASWLRSISGGLLVTGAYAGAQLLFIRLRSGRQPLSNR